MLKSSTREEIQRYYQTRFVSMIVSKGMFFSMQNSAHAWKELPCGYTRPRRFWHVFHWAKWHSSTKSKSCTTWSFCRDSPFPWIPEKIFCAVRENGWENSFWGRFWLGFRSWVGIRVLLWFLLTKWVWLWVGGSFRVNFIWESKGSYHSREDFSTGTRFRCTSEG